MSYLASQTNEAIVAMAAIRTAQPYWADIPIKNRLAIIARLRRLLAADCQSWAATAARPNMKLGEILVAEVLPCLAACRFLERQAARILAPRSPLGRRPAWLIGTSLVVRRMPFGGILIIAPRNYPLLLPFVQIIQALAAGNGVMVKPAPGYIETMRFLADALKRSGLPEGLFAVLPDSHVAGENALSAGADKVVLTGGEDTGRYVLAQLSKSITPATMELSGDDALVVLPGSPIPTVAQAIAYGLMLNGGETCIAPRRIIAIGNTGPELARHLETLLPRLPLKHVSSDEKERLSTAIAQALFHGSRLIGEPVQLEDCVMRPVVAVVTTPQQKLPPLFGAVASLVMVDDVEAAVSIANAGSYSLGASVFGPFREAQLVGRQLRVGCVVINDVIIPTADPRLPFGGSGSSGFGVTRGAEGLLEMTRPQATISRRRPIRMQYREVPDAAVSWIIRGLKLIYG